MSNLIITPHGANLTHIIWFQNKEYITYYDKDGQQIMFKHIANLTSLPEKYKYTFSVFCLPQILLNLSSHHSFSFTVTCTFLPLNLPS